MGVIKNNKYIKDGKPMPLPPSDQYKAYRHSEQRLDHKADILQPRVGGKPNSEFIQTYPENAKDYFSKEEYERGMNE
jgi:hypothetical protein